MSNSLRSFRAIVCAVTLLAFAVVIGCSSGGSSAAAPPISVSISPATGSAATMVSGATQNFTATIANDSTTTPGVIWAISSGGGALTNVTATSVTYTAANPVTGTSAVLIATSKTDGSKSASVSITLTPVAVSAISPATATLGTADTQGFSGAVVTGDTSNAGVTWTISPATGAGTINATTGVYGAPTGVISATTTVTVTATSVKDPTKFQTATITLQPISVSAISPSTVSLAGGGTQTFSGAAVSHDGTSSGVTWAVSPSTGAGTITNAGVYTAPAVVGSTVSATITATSVKDPTKSATAATVTLLPVSVSFGSTTSYAIDSQQQLNIPVPTVTNDSSNSGVTYSATAGTTGLGPNGYFAFNAPTIASGQTTVTITATSVKDTSKPATVTVTVNPSISASPAAGSTLTAGTTGTAYSQLITLSNGTGTKTLVLKSGQTLPPGLSVTGTTISGTPTTAGSYTFVLTASDQSAVPPVINYTYTIAVTAGPLVWTTSGTLAPATTGIAYSQNLVTAGGTGAITCQAGPVTGTLPGGLQINSNCTITGTPTGTGSFTFTAKATDSASTTTTSGNLTIVASNPVGATISGNVNLTNSCGGATTPPVTMTLTQGATTISSTATVNGAYTLVGVAAGTYTLTPSISGASSVFFPATQTVIITGTTNTTGNNFSAALGYTVSGTVTYAGTRTGPTYITLTPNCGSGNSGVPGTSLATVSSSGTAYTVRGVPIGSYGVSVAMDNVGKGAANATNPVNAISPVANVTNANVTGMNVTIADPGVVTLSTAPVIDGVQPFNTGALVEYEALSSGNTETATAYTLEWSTSSTFATTTGTKTFVATGTNGANVWIVNGLTDGTTYYFRVKGATVGGSTSPYSAISSGVVIGAPTGGVAVSGSVTIPGTIGGPLYVVLIDNVSHTIYGQYITSPAAVQAFTIHAPISTNAYQLFAIVDNNNDGMIDAGDLSNTGSNGSALTVSGALANQNLTLTGGNALLTLYTGHNHSTVGVNSADSYNINLGVSSVLKQVTSVALTAGPSAVKPQDIGLCNNCGGSFAAQFNLGTTAPTVGDSYSVLVGYSDGTTETLTKTISGVVSAFATALAPSGTSSTSLTPTFTWTYPASASSYTYSFNLCCYNNNTIWQIPGNNSSAGFTSTAVTSVPWSTTVDPTGAANPPTVPALTHGTTYSWQLQTIDANSNTGTQQVVYAP